MKRPSDARLRAMVEYLNIIGLTVCLFEDKDDTKESVYWRLSQREVINYRAFNESFSDSKTKG